MWVTTMDDAPACRIDMVIGQVAGHTVRSFNIGSHTGARFRALAGRA